MRAQPVAGAFDLDDHGMVEQSVEQCGGDDGVAEDFSPFSEAAIAGEDHGAFFVSGVDQLEEQVGAAVGDWEIADLVDDQERGAAIEADLLDQASLAFGAAERFDQLGKGAAVDAFACFDSGNAEGHRPSGFSPVPGGPRR